MDKSSLSETIELIRKSKKNANYIIFLLTGMKSEDRDKRIAHANACSEVFSHFFTNKEWLKAKERHHANPTPASETSSNADEKFNEWIIKNYEEFLNCSLGKLHGDEEESKINQEILMSFLLLEYKTMTKTNVFPSRLFFKILKHTVESTHSFLAKELADTYFMYVDIKFYTLKNIPQIMDKATRLPTATHIAKNVYVLLTRITMPTLPIKLVDMYINQANVDGLEVNTTFMNKKYRAMCSKAWLSLLRESQATSGVQKLILLDMDTKIIPCVSDPKLLIDFLTDNYNKGGASSLLALNSLFTLMNGYNLEYPDFYRKLYSLYQPSTFHVKYKSRLYHLSNLFFSSTHMPAYLVAAFIKRMARLCLFAPVADILAMLALTKNMFVRFPSVGVLIHRNSASSKTSTGDQYNPTEPDPAKCGAMESSLWELAALKQHHNSDVVKMVASFKKEFGHVEEDISKHLDTSYDSLVVDLLGRDLQKQTKQVAMCIERPTSFFHASDGMWAM